MYKLFLQRKERRLLNGHCMTHSMWNVYKQLRAKVCIPEGSRAEQHKSGYFYCQEITSSNPDNTTTIHDQEPREQNWPWSLGERGMAYNLFPFVITAALANHWYLWDNVYPRRADSAFLWMRYAAMWCLKLQKKVVGWLHVSLSVSKF